MSRQENPGEGAPAHPGQHEDGPRGAAIVLDHVTFQYDSQAEPTLVDVSLHVEPGEKVLVVGPSGSGKSTLGSLINGIIPHSLTGELTGTVTVDGVDVASSSLFELSEHVGTVLQDPDGQFVGLTTAEDIAFALENDAVPVGPMHERVHRWASTLGIADQLGQSPQSLSGGQKQRTSMAGVLIDEGPILLFDEPLAALDPATGRASIALIDELHERLGVTVVIIEHRLEEVLTRHVDRVVVMDDGRIVADTAPDELLRSDLLARTGLREPLYVEAFTLAGLDTGAATALESVTTVDVPGMARALSAWVDEDSEPPARPPAAPLLEIAGLSVSYPDGPSVLRGLDLTVDRGDVLALVGRNGVGKTTLVQAVTGFVTPDAGTMTLDGTDLATLSVKERADRIGYIMQNPNRMISQVLIRDEVALGLRLRRVDEEETARRVEAVLEVCGLRPYRSWPVSALSYGQRKRVTIASILVLEPEVLILDEPTAGQDWHHYTEMMRFLESLNRERGITLVLVTHDMHLMLEYATRTVVLDDGAVLMDASPASVLTDPDVVDRADLAPTSLQALAERTGLDPVRLTHRLIAHERRVRG